MTHPFFKLIGSNIIMPASSMRLQSAIEYLTSYAWAIIVIVIVIFALYTFGFFNNSPTFCNLGSGFSCQSYFLAANGVLTATILQTTSSQISVTGLACGTNSSPKFQSMTPVIQNSSSTQAYSVQCLTSNGNAFSGTQGTTFKGSLILRYKDNFTGYAHTVYGSLETKVTSP